MTGLFELINAQSWFYGDKLENDSNSLMGSNTLGGQLGQISSLASWYLDSEMTKVSPKLDRTGYAFAQEWARRKGNNINKEFAKALAAVLVQNPLTKKYLLKFGKELHRSKSLWIKYNVAIHLATLYVNYWFMDKSGAWSYRF